ncbi:hypothetical protein GCM10020219_033620 [Nonomuraea dietziae]
MLACHPDAPARSPEGPDDLDRLLQRDLVLARGAVGAAEGGDRLAVATRSETEFEAPTTEQVERGRRLGDHTGAAERQARHIRKYPDPRGVGEQCGDHAERVGQAARVRVVLHAEEVEPLPVGQSGQLADPERPSADGDSWTPKR